MTKFKWELSKPPEAKELEVSAPGLFGIHMERAFGAFPIELTEKDLGKLEGMAATWTDISVSPYVHLIQAVRRYKAIRVWPEYETSPDDFVKVHEQERKETFIEGRADEHYRETGKMPGE